MASRTFDGAMKRLEEITRLLETGEQTLEQSIQLYEEGSKLSAFCAKKLNEAEQKVLSLDELGTKEEAE